MEIHSNESTNTFIHKMLTEKPEVNTNFVHKLSFIISNGNAILPFFTHAVDITPLNFYILFFINRLEGNPGLLFANNSFTTDDPINFDMASINIWFECE